MSILDKITFVPEAQIEIPSRTSKKRYISGYYALYVFPPEETSGDWHDVWHWREGIDRPRDITLAGYGTDINTNDIWGDWGVYEGKDRLLKKDLKIKERITEVYIANHFRAILDLLYRDLRRFDRADTLFFASTDWLDTEEQKELLLSKAELLRYEFQLKPKLLEGLQTWIDHERAAE